MPRVSRWLRGSVHANKHGNYVRLATEMWWGNLRFETYLTRTEARQLRDELNVILAAGGLTGKEQT